MAVLLTQKTVKIGGIAGLIVVAIAGGYLVGSPAITEYSNAKQEYADAQTQLETRKAGLAALEQSEANYKTIQAIDDNLDVQFPQVANTEEYTRVLVEALASANLPQSSLLSATFSPPLKQVPKAANQGTVDPGAAGEGTTGTGEEAPAEEAPAEQPADGKPIDTQANSNEFATVEVGVTIAGSTQQVQQVLDYLNKADRAILINQFSVKKTETGAELSFMGNILIYPAILTPDEQIAQTADPAAPTDGTEPATDPATP